MKWKDDDQRAGVKATLALLREGDTAFQKLMACKDAELVETISTLDQSDLRAIVFERVIAARYQPPPRASGS